MAHIVRRGGSGSGSGSGSISGMNMGVWAFVGDSFTAQAINSQTSVLWNWEALGYITALRQVSRQRIRVPYFEVEDDGASGQDPVAGYVWAKSGKASDWFVAEGYHISAAATDAGIVFAPISTNDTSQAVAFATSVANYTLIWQTLLNAGKTVVTMPILPRVLSASTTTIRNASARLNAWARNYAQEHGIIWVDPTPRFIDATNADGDPLASMVRDASLHPSGLGNFTIADYIWEATEHLVPAFDNRFMNISHVYHSTQNPAGNLLVNGLMAGTGGTITAGSGGVAMSGQLADSGTAQRGATTSTGSVAASDTSIGSLTCVWSKVARTDGEVGTWQQGVVSGTPDAVKELQLIQAITIGNVAAGDSLGLALGYLYDAATDATVRDGDRANATGSSVIYLTTDARSLVYETTEFTLTATPAALTAYLLVQCQASVAAALTFRIGRVKLYKIETV